MTESPLITALTRRLTNGNVNRYGVRAGSGSDGIRWTPPSDWAVPGILGAKQKTLWPRNCRPEANASTDATTPLMTGR